MDMDTKTETGPGRARDAAEAFGRIEGGGGSGGGDPRFRGRAA